MKAIISTTFDNNYLYFLPIVTYCWNKIGIDVICFMPFNESGSNSAEKIYLINEVIRNKGLEFSKYIYLSPEHKEATYAQVSRLYAASLDLPEGGVLITSDCDMAVFGDYLKQKNADFDIFGYDLTPQNQYPICYISATVAHWRNAMNINGRSYQQCLDDTVGKIECENFRGNQWSFDQNLAFKQISQYNNKYLHGRARPGTQFASKRVDRDDSFWEDRLSPDVIDAHLWRPGYTDENFPKILKLLKYFYPDDNFDWLIEYTTKYRQLL